MAKKASLIDKHPGLVISPYKKKKKKQEKREKKENKYKYDLFLSFSSQDIDFVKPIWEKLTKKGLKVFFSNEALKKSIGLDFDEEIEKGLEQSRHFVLVCTPNAMKSEWVKDEYKAFYHHIYKKSKGKRRFIILEGPNFDIELVPILMRRLQTAKSIDDAIETLVDKAAKKEKHQKKSKILKWSSAAITLVGLAASIITIIDFSKKDLNSKKELQNNSAIHAIIPTKQKIYVSTLSFMDGITNTTMGQTETSVLINEAVFTGMEMGIKANPDLEINAPGHEIPNTDANVNELIILIFDPDSTKKEKINNIINDIMIPYKVDIIVTGFYIDTAKNPWIIVRPIIIVKSWREIISKNFQFKKDELVCIDPDTKKKILCQKAYEGIGQALNELLIEQSERKIYLTNLSFMDAQTRSIMSQTEITAQINEAVTKGMNIMQRYNDDLEINDSVHEIPNTDINVNKLAKIIFDSNLTSDEKINKIINDLMTPNNVDVIISGYYIGYPKSPSITARLLIIIKSREKIITKNLQFNKNEFTCELPTSKKKILRQQPFNEIVGAVQELIMEMGHELQLELKIQSSQKKYVTNLSFMDTQTMSTMVQTKMAALINEAVENGMNMVEKECPGLVINVPGHKITNTDANVYKLVNIVFDPNLTKNEKINKVIKDIMNPNGVDVIVTGHYIVNAKYPMIMVRPHVYVKSQQKIISKKLQFKKAELECQAPDTKKTILFRGAFDQIAQAVKELLEQVY